MKSKILLTAIAVSVSLCGYAQTKGTNALGFGISSSTQKSSSFGSTNEVKNNYLSLSYGYFVSDNNKIGLELSYMKSTSNLNSNGEQDTKGYGGNLSYQKYFPIFKTLYAYAGGSGAYSFQRQDSNLANPLNPNSDFKSNQYSIGAHGGITWFLSKRFALETNLLSASVNYSKTTQKALSNNNTIDYETKATSFDLKTSGVINDLGFKIYILF